MHFDRQTATTTILYQTTGLNSTIFQPALDEKEKKLSKS